MKILNGIQSDEEFKRILDRHEQIGVGTSRCVYGLKTSRDFIIKESQLQFHHSNFVEWTVWHAVNKMRESKFGNHPNGELAGMFAECAAISHSARYLLMERLTPIPNEFPLDTLEFPDWLNDKKRSAFGTSKDNRLKVMDYGMVDFYKVLNPRNRTSCI